MLLGGCGTSQVCIICVFRFGIPGVVWLKGSPKRT